MLAKRINPYLLLDGGRRVRGGLAQSTPNAPTEARSRESRTGDLPFRFGSTSPACREPGAHTGGDAFVTCRGCNPCLAAAGVVVGGAT